MTHHTPESLLKYLTELGIQYEQHHHAPVMTAKDHDTVVDSLPGVNVRNLFLRDKKHQYWLISIPLDLPPVDLKALRHQLGTAGVLSFGDERNLIEKLGVKPGSVCPYGAINDKGLHVNIVLDERILVGPRTNAHPLTNTQTICVAPEDLIRFLHSTNHPPKILKVPTQ